MAWRPTRNLIEGELNNTVPGKVTGWMKFAGMQEKVTFNLTGNFHRDIRGAKVHLKGEGREKDLEAVGDMQGFSEVQHGDVGDMTAGLPPADYVKGYGYFEWYGEANGRVVLELESDQVEVIGQPIPWIESDPIDRAQQQRNMGNFLTGLCQSTGVPAIVCHAQLVASDPTFSHFVIEGGEIVGEAKDVEPPENGISFAFVRLFNMPEMAEYGSIEAEKLQRKDEAAGEGG